MPKKNGTRYKCFSLLPTELTNNIVMFIPRPLHAKIMQDLINLKNHKKVYFKVMEDLEWHDYFYRDMPELEPVNDTEWLRHTFTYY